MGSGINSPRGLDSSSSLELALDQAIARRWASGQDRPGRRRRMSPYPAALGQTYTPTPKLGSASPTALTVTSSSSSKDTALAVVPTRLRWRGIEVSEEFQAYAARVERGEALAPYRGAVLSRACAEFPWSAAPPALMLPPPLTVYPERGRAMRTALWVTGALASIVGALGVGAGATSADDELDANIQSTARSLKLAPVDPSNKTLTSPESVDHDAQLPSPSIAARQLASLAAAADTAPVRAASPASPRRAQPSSQPRLQGLLRPPKAPVASAPSSAHSSPLTTSAASQLPRSADPARSSALTVTARADAPVEDTSGRGSALFSDQAPF